MVGRGYFDEDKVQKLPENIKKDIIEHIITNLRITALSQYFNFNEGFDYVQHRSDLPLLRKNIYGLNGTKAIKHYLEKNKNIPQSYLEIIEQTKYQKKEEPKTPQSKTPQRAPNILTPKRRGTMSWEEDLKINYKELYDKIVEFFSETSRHLLKIEMGEVIGVSSKAVQMFWQVYYDSFKKHGLSDENNARIFELVNDFVDKHLNEIHLTSGVFQNVQKDLREAFREFKSKQEQIASPQPQQRSPQQMSPEPPQREQEAPFVPLEIQGNKMNREEQYIMRLEFFYPNPFVESETILYIDVFV